jgi:YD repeat-containing protein
VPQQTGTAVTTWTYNADDSVNTVTDARGALTTYSYEGTLRQLVKSITHTLSGSATVGLVYDYDAAGNRISMIHSVGGAEQDSIDYVYDQLSRLTSETKHINALESNPSTDGDYEIEYEYTLGGNLKSVTDPFGGITNLTYDATGRTVSVTGSVGAVNHTYISNIGYRAWGAIRSMSVGSLTDTRTYNQRLQPTQYRYAQFRYDYTYYDDGRLKELIDLDDQVGAPSQVTFHYMSRKYAYDYVGRISAVFARSTPQNVPAPFVGNYSYDEFGNMKSRSGYYALNTNTTSTATFVNNRRDATGWSYDADGRVLTSADTGTSSTQTWNYDATGNPITITETISVPTPPKTTTNTLRYDGNGALLFESVASPTETKSNYLINSTVLKAVLTKMDANGDKDLTYVPANGMARPTQGKDLSGNPTFGVIPVDASGLQEGGRAVDPFGARVMNVQPPDSTEEMANTHVFGPPYSGTSWSQFTNANNFTTGCSVDGVRSTCRSALEAISHGMADGVIQGPGAGGAAGVLALFGIAPMVHTIPQQGDNERPPEDATIWVEFVPTGGGETTTTDPQNPEEKEPISCGKVELLDDFRAGYKRGPLDVRPANVAATGVRMTQGAAFPNTFGLRIPDKIDPNGILAIRVSFHSSKDLTWEGNETSVSTNEEKVRWKVLVPDEVSGQAATQTDFQEQFAEITFRVKAIDLKAPNNTIDVKVAAARERKFKDINNRRFRLKEFQTCRVRLFH